MSASDPSFNWNNPAYPLNKPNVPFSSASIPTANSAVVDLLGNTVNFGCWLHELVITNPTNSSVTVQIEDGNGTILIPYPDTISSGGTISYQGHVWMVNGILWKASATGVHAKGRYST